MLNPDLYKRSLWINKNIEFLFGTDITEYDIHSAGPSLCKQFQLLPKEKLDQLDKMDKKARSVQLGLYQRKDKEFAKKLSEAFSEARKWFLVKNELDEENIISIKKDAIFVCNRFCHETTFGEVVFNGKNHYTSYLRLNKLEFYINTITSNIDIKGLGQGNALDEVKNYHGKYLLHFIETFCKLREKETSRKDASMVLGDFVRNYREKKLPIEYYRMLTRGNMYLLYDPEGNEMLEVEDTDDIENIDIGYNYQNYILPLVSLYL